MSTKKSHSDCDPHESPAAWFVVLEIARKKGDTERAAQALRELRRLGVHVSYGTRVPPIPQGVRHG